DPVLTRGTSRLRPSARVGAARRRGCHTATRTDGSVHEPEREDRQVLGLQRHGLDWHGPLLLEGAQRPRLRRDALDDRVDEGAFLELDMAIDHRPVLLESRVRGSRPRMRGEMQRALATQLGALDVPAAAMRAAAGGRKGELAAGLALHGPYRTLGQAIVVPADGISLFVQGLHLTFLRER